ncbi:aminotransferase class V-fold PLP-dependent enzyme [Bacillus sp. Marseille-P3800]|uniref:aminotransferase class V-fold PLP-dependent enzyme n=1 Tax=Bacillus sp. Marseille-P3800 TaxID=2014782 RepID=UPI0021000DCD|nr:aminotransferase class V-fold PLP-dependent enzyme [Bacillus sp. Marseille-P3800]
MSDSLLFNKPLDSFMQEQFYYLDEDITGNKRLFFENSGGSLRLKNVVQADARIASYPDCPERLHDMALEIRKIIENGLNDVHIMLNATSGSILPIDTASRAMFEMIGSFSQATAGGNIVTTALEHPSAYDACVHYADLHKKELRVAEADPLTGTVLTKSIIELIDKNTNLLAFVATSNITGAILDIPEIVKQARAINPEMYIVIDAVQYAPHGVVDLEKWDVDGLNIAPYKMFGNRGMAFAYISERAASITHLKLAAAPADKWGLGSPAPAHYAGFSEIVNYICTLGSYVSKSTDRRAQYVNGMTLIEDRERALHTFLLHGDQDTPGLLQLDGLTVHFKDQPLEQKDFIVGLSFDDLSWSKAVELYTKKGVLVYERLATSYYSKRILESVQLEGLIRVSPLHCHTLDDMRTFIHITQSLLRVNGR